jgi:4-hydroxy-tetrahydrodipicolinate synthase
MNKLEGVFPVLPTPFSPDGAIDRRAFAGLVDFVVGAGADGIVFPGMASEVEKLTPDERALLVADLGKHIGGRLPIIVGASAATPDAAAAFAEEGHKIGAVAAMIMAPAACGADVACHIAFYSAVAAKTGIALMLQNAPTPMGAGLSPEAVAQIVLAVPAIRYVKEETLPCGQHVTKILALAGDRLDGVFGGAGARYVIDELARGARGTMPASELADVHVALMRAWRGGDKKRARALYSRTLPLLLFQAIFRVRATKTLLRMRGLLDCDFARAAGPELDASDRAEFADLAAEAADLFERHPLLRDI